MTQPHYIDRELAEIVSDEEIVRVHGSANFGSMPPRQVVNDGISKIAVGYHCGHTQFSILRDHGLITKPKGMSYDCNLTKKGKRYFRALSRRPAPMEAVAWRHRRRNHPRAGWVYNEFVGAAGLGPEYEVQALAVIPTQGLSSSSPKSEDTHRAAETAVVGWQPIDTAPKDAVLLLFGQIGYGRNDGHPSGPIRACGYWDEIDSAWAFTDTTWEGPFMEPTHWMTLPEEPGKTS